MLRFLVPFQIVWAGAAITTFWAIHRVLLDAQRLCSVRMIGTDVPVQVLLGTGFVHALSATEALNVSGGIMLPSNSCYLSWRPNNGKQV